MSGAVGRAEQAVSRAREQAAPMGNLPGLARQLRLVAAQVDRNLVLQASAGVHQVGFERATGRVAKVVSASTRIEFAATTCVEGTRNSRERSIASSVDHEASQILADLAADADLAVDAGAAPDTSDRRSTSAQ
ncbi:MAG: hypothetical protein WB765_20725 [Acidimicrobiales bacterium]|jgi:hypothetical protein